MAGDVSSWWANLDPVPKPNAPATVASTSQTVSLSGQVCLCPLLSSCKIYSLTCSQGVVRNVARACKQIQSCMLLLRVHALNAAVTAACRRSSRYHSSSRTSKHQRYVMLSNQISACMYRDCLTGQCGGSAALRSCGHRRAIGAVPLHACTSVSLCTQQLHSIYAGMLVFEQLP